MAIGLNQITANFDDTDNTAFVTASGNPTANALQLFAIAVRNGSSTNPSTPTVTGCGLTWTLVNSSLFDDNSSSRRKVFVFQAIGASPSSGAVTATFGETETEACWSWVEFTGVKISAPIVQSANNRINTGDTPASSLTVTLAAFSNTHNATYGAFAEQGTGAGFSVGSGFTLLDNVPDTTSAGLTVFTEWKNSNDTSVDVNMGGSFDGIGGVAIEIAAGDVSIASSVQSATFSQPAITVTARRKMPTLTDNFNDNSLDTAVFGSFGTTVAETNQELQLQMATSYGSYLGVFTLNRYDMQSSACIVKLTSAGDQSLTSNQALFQLEFDFDNQVYFLIETNLLKAVKKVSGSVSDVTGSIAYSSTNHKYLKISESGGTLTWWYSADGQAWTSFCTLANPFAVTGLQVNLLAGTYSVEASPSTVIWDDLNYLHPTIASSVQSATFSQPSPTVTTTRNVTVSASVQSATFSQPAPTITANRSVTVSASVQTATFSTQSPSITANRSVTVNSSVQSATFSQPAPTITANRSVTVSPDVQAATFSQPTPTVTANRSVTVSASVQTATFSTPAPTVGSVTNVTVNATVQSLTFSQPTPTTTAIRNVSNSPSAQSATFSQPSPSVVAIRNVSVSPSVQSASFSQPAPTISAARNVTVAVGVGVLTFSQPLPVYPTGDHVTTLVGVLALQFSLQAPTIRTNEWAIQSNDDWANQETIPIGTVSEPTFATQNSGDWAIDNTNNWGA